MKPRRKTTRIPPRRSEDDAYRRLFRAHPQPLFVCDASTRAILEVSDAALHAYGYDRNRFLSMTMDDLLAPEPDAPPPADTGRRRQEPVWSGRLRHVRSDGRIIDVTLDSRATRFQGGNARLVAVEDVSERLVEERLTRQWADAFNNCALGIDFNLPSGQILTCNPAFARAHRSTVEEIVSRPTLSLYAPEDHELVRRCVAECDRSGSVRYEAHMVRADGSRFPVQIDLVSVRDAGGTVIYRVATAQDITERKEEQERLRSRDRTIRTFVEQAPAAIAILDRDMRYLATSRRFLSDYRLADQPVIGRSHYDLFPDIPERWKEIHRRCLAGAVESAEEDAFPRNDGSVDWVRWEIHPWYETQGTIGGIILFSEVITERKKSEELLRENETRLRSIGDNLPESFVYQYTYERDRTPRFLHVSAGVERLHGVSAGAVLADASVLLTRIDPAHTGALGAAERESERTLRDFEMEIRIMGADGQWRWMHLRSRPRKRADGQVIWDGVATDVSSRKNMEQDLVFRNVLLTTQQEATIDGILVVDEHNRITSYNRRFMEMWKIPPSLIRNGDDEPILQHNAALVADPDGFVSRVHDLYDHMNDASRDEVGLKDGRIFDRYSAPMSGPDGAYLGRVWYFRDITERKRSEEALVESERRFRQLFDEAPVGYHELDVEGRIIHVNHTELDMLGYTVSELRRHHAWEFVDDAETSRDSFLAKITGKLSAEAPYERSFRKKDGTLISVLCKDRLLYDQKGEITGLRSALQDITERKAADRQLRLMGQSVASAQDCIAITDLEHRILYVNGAISLVYGYPADDLAGREIFVLSSRNTPPADTARRLDETLQGGWHGEVVNRRKDGSEFPVEVWTSLVRDEFGIPVAILYVARDITERKAAEARIRRTESQFRLIAENVTDLIAVLDPEGRRVYLSPSYRTIMADPDAMIGTDGFTEIHPDDRERVQRLFRETVAHGVPGKAEYRTIRGDGVERIIESRGSAVRGPDGRASQVIVVSRDVTEEKKIAAQLLRAQRMESIGTLASGIAHDLNNVLAPIMMSIDVLKSKIPGPGGQKILTTIETSAKRGSDIVKQVLAFGRGVAGDRIPVQPRHVIGEVVKIARETFPRSIDVSADLPRDLWTIPADPTQLHQVILNIFVNARDAMPGGGSLTVSAANSTVDATFVRMHPGATPGPYVALSISDSGEGIPPDIREKIFEPFFTTKEVGMGTGLGLSTTIAIVRSHGGFINLYSEVGRGTTFKVYFPATPSAADPAAAGKIMPLPVGHGELVLVIDDEAAIREITRATLEAHGYRVLTASNGEEGVAVFAGRPGEIRAVLTDIMMPVMDGTAAIRALRRLRPDVRIIATSGLTTRERIGGTSEPAAEAFIAKPYTAEQLIRMLAETLR